MSFEKRDEFRLLAGGGEESVEEANVATEGSEQQAKSSHGPEGLVWQDHPLAGQLEAYVNHLNAWILANREWDARCAKFTLQGKLVGISREHHYAAAVANSGALFLLEIR